MSLADKLQTLETVQSTTKGDCIERILRAGGPDAEALEKALRNPVISVRSIFDALKDEGYAVTRDTVAKHRKKFTSGSIDQA